MNRSNLLIAAVMLASTGAVQAQSANPATSQGTHTHQPFLRRDVPSITWPYDGRDDVRDFQTNGVFPGDFAAEPGSAWIGAAGLLGFTPSGGSHNGPIYCTRRYRSHNPMPGYFQGEDGAWYRCHR